MNYLKDNNLQNYKKLVSFQKALLEWCEDEPRKLLEMAIHQERGKHLHKRKKFILTEIEKETITKVGLIKIRNSVVEYINTRIKKPANLEKLEFCDNHPIFPAKYATGLCCRKCISECYKIKEWVVLTEEEEDKFVLVIMKWIQTQCDTAV